MQVVYVGRTTDYDKRMKQHRRNPARRHLTPDILHEGLTYKEARALEHGYILLFSTLDKSNKSYNQINGINRNRLDYSDLLRSGFGFNEALDSLFTNEILTLFE